MPRVRLILAPLAVLALAATGCGSSSSSSASSSAAAPRASAPPATQSTSSAPSTVPAPTTGIPAGVPTEATGRTDPAQLKVIETWVDALRRGDYDAAAATFADGAVVANGTPLLKLAGRSERRAFNATFPCGAKVTRSASARGYVVVTFVLVKRKGATCDATPGATARSAIRVRRGAITEWYRLPTEATPPGGDGGGGGGGGTAPDPDEPTI